MEIAIWIGIALIGGLAIAAMIIPDWTRNVALAKLGGAGEFRRSRRSARPSQDWCLPFPSA